MVALQIREVPEEVRDVLVERARARGQSLQAYLLALVEHDARRTRNAAVLRRFTRRGDGVAETDVDALVDALRTARDENDARRTPGSGRH